MQQSHFGQAPQDYSDPPAGYGSAQYQPDNREHDRLHQSQYHNHIDTLFPPALDHLTPESMLTDSAYAQSSAFTTPAFEDVVVNADGTFDWPVDQTSFVFQPPAQRQDTAPSQARSGLAPDQRTGVNEVEVPSLNDQEQNRKLSEDITRVRTWLERSRLEGADDPNNQAPSPRANGRRSRATSAARSQAQQPTLPTTADATIQPSILVVDDEENGIDQQGDDDDASQGDGSSYRGDTTPPARRESLEQFSQAWPSHTATMPKEQPPNSNAAISIFMRRAQDIETASLTATLGSRRRSETDVSSLFSSPGISRVNTRHLSRSHDNATKYGSLFDRIAPRRSVSNSKKRKEDHDRPGDSNEDGHHARKESASSLATVKRALARPKSPRLDTSIGQGGRPTGTSPISPSNLLSAGPWNQAKSAIGRLRSKSEARAGHTAGLTEMWTRQGGPPALSLRPPAATGQAEDQSAPERAQHLNQEDMEEDDEENINTRPIAMDLKITDIPTDPTFEGFRSHAQRLNPSLPDFMAHRITQEQMKRHRRLIGFRMTHSKATSRGNCPSGERCNVLGQGPLYLTPPPSSATAEHGPVIFYISCHGDAHNAASPQDKGASIAATFPDGIPIPPVNRLPAEFECPLCFQVKKIWKPSDWTKHVHEDVSPFTCTFPTCAEPKSFKRKADWVRHESELHRHLESWTCSYHECQHVCYRKDNFVQHLVREHRLPEPRVRASKAAARGNEYNNDESIVTGMVESCRQESTRQPDSEPCRFCGNICTSWKNLTVHLAKHMEQVSMPILGLVDRDAGSLHDENAHGQGDPFVQSGVELRGFDAPKMEPQRSTSSLHPNAPAATGGSPARVMTPVSISITGVAPQTGSTYPPTGSRSRSGSFNSAIQAVRSVNVPTFGQGYANVPNGATSGTGSPYVRSGANSPYYPDGALNRDDAPQQASPHQPSGPGMNGYGPVQGLEMGLSTQEFQGHSGHSAATYPPTWAPVRGMLPGTAPQTLDNGGNVFPDAFTSTSPVDAGEMAAFPSSGNFALTATNYDFNENGYTEFSMPNQSFFDTTRGIPTFGTQQATDGTMFGQPRQSNQHQMASQDPISYEGGQDTGYAPHQQQRQRQQQMMLMHQQYMANNTGGQGWNNGQNQFNGY